MNGPIRNVSVVAMLMFAALLANSSVSYIVNSDSLDANPHNRRVLDAQYAQQRGPIMVGNTPVVQSEKVKDRFKYLRVYKDGPLYAPVTGFYSYYYKRSGLEETRSNELAGIDDSQAFERLLNQISGSQPEGGAVETTLVAKAQKAAWKALGGRKGAVVALDTSTGAIRTLVTSPSYDPNLLSTHDLDASKQAWDKLTADPSRPMANRATREIYPPGSTFKLVTAAAALEDGLTPNTHIDASEYRVSKNKVMKANCGGREITLARALLVSCNPGFARLGAELGADKLLEQAEAFGFGSAPLTDIGSA
ncbi:MAG: penicillin-binding protein 2, partial [Propionibacteriaceae bacterium]|nr:penicillin-binding protein 2 [Propionibacteriaceae bacterium]